MNDREYIYGGMPVRRAVLTMAVPTVISQIISMIYNIADTFFIGQLNDPAQVAAVSVAAPAALVLTALANLFGIGGASMFSRALGDRDTEKARRVSAFCGALAVLIGLCISLLLGLFPRFIVRTLGADPDTLPHAMEYVFWVITLGAPVSLLSMVLSHFVRADGSPKFAGTALSLGGIVNLILDPIFIFNWGLGMGVRGAAIATLLSNTVTLAAFIIHIYRRRKETVMSFSPRRLGPDPGMWRGVVGAGLPSMLQTLLASLSNVVLNNVVEPFGASALAAFGVVKKLDQIPMSITIGFAQGIVPLIGYSHSNKNENRMQSIIRFTLAASVGISLLTVLVYELFPQALISLFIDHPDTLLVGAPVLRIMCMSTPLMAVGFIFVTYFQATGRNRYGVILSVMRKGAIDIPLLYLFSLSFPLALIAAVQPIAEGLTLLAALFLYCKSRRRS